MRRSIPPTELTCAHPGPSVLYNAAGPEVWCSSCGVELTASRPTIPTWLVLAIAVWLLVALLGGLLVLTANWRVADGPRPTPGRGVSTYEPPAAEPRVVG